MTGSVTFSTGIGGDGSTVTDDDNATTGLRDGGWRTRFVPCFTNQVSIANYVVTQANAASASATAAGSSATSAAAAYDSFDDRYLGSKTSDPTLDNDGNALLTGALYWNSTSSVMKVYSGSAWSAAYVPSSGYLALTGGTMTGAITFAAAQFGTNVNTFLTTPTSANLAAALTDETGTGLTVFNNTPTLIAPILGTPTSGNLANCTFPTLNQSTTGTAATATNLASGSAGTIPYQSASGTTAMLAAGTSGQVLTSNGSSAPTWSPASGGATKTISNKTGAYTVVAGDLGKIINCTSGTFSVNLTAAATLGAGFTCTIWNTSTTNTDPITIDPAGTETIDGVSTITINAGEGLGIVCDGTNWQTDDKKPMRGYAENLYISDTRPNASGMYAIAIGSYGATASGNSSLAIGRLTTASANYTTAIGVNSGGTGSQAVTGAGAMALGGSYASGVDSFAAAIANNTSSYGATGDYAICMGYQAKVTASNSVAIGRSCVTSGGFSIALGYGATSSGFESAAFGPESSASANYSTAIGFGATVSAANEIQLGNSASTTYVYGTVQNRSDKRDKADIRDTVLGLEFINKLRPVDFKWDFREDYKNSLPDGSKKRTRFHHGLIAQDLQKVIEETDIDFGGFQDHTIIGGSDVLSIGYDELIAPLIKAVQELSAEFNEYRRTHP